MCLRISNQKFSKTWNTNYWKHPYVLINIEKVEKLCLLLYFFSFITNIICESLGYLILCLSLFDTITTQTMVIKFCLRRVDRKGMCHFKYFLKQIQLLFDRSRLNILYLSANNVFANSFCILLIKIVASSKTI